MGKLLVINKNKCMAVLLMEDRLAQMISIIEKSDDPIIPGNIYIGRVTSVVPGISAAFVAIDKEHTVFLPLSECKNVLLANREFDGCLKQGDEIVVQIVTKALKTKQPGASARLNLVGQYSVCDYFGRGLHFSSKMDKETIRVLKDKISGAEVSGRKKTGFTIRTNAGELTDKSALLNEMEFFSSVFKELSEKYTCRTCFTCLYRTESELIRSIEDIPLSRYDEIITDDLQIYEVLKQVEMKPLRLYTDDRVTLSRLYSVDTNLSEAAAKKVWLPSGGYLIIEPTEAMVVIDVNSGKNDGKSKKQTSLYFRTNMEAAKEIARQLRIRNYSGMIMIDFINMESEEEQQELLNEFAVYLMEDTIKTRLVDMTALGIVEVTRKKVSKPLDISLL